MKRLTLALAILSLAAVTRSESRTATLAVKGWSCGSCAAATRIALKKLDGVSDVRVDAEKAEAVVTYDDTRVTPERMIEAVGRIGYKATLKAGALVPGSPHAQSTAIPQATNDKPALSERISLFEIPLECGASEGLGCGSAAKPILQELDASPRIAQARINHPGTLLAVVWKNPNDRSDSAVEALFEKHKLAASVLKGKDREKAYQDYRSEQWYGSADVDRLSEHEARVIAARIVHRAGGRLGLAPDRLAALTEDLALVFARHLTLRDEECDSRREDIERELKTAASKYLDSQQLAELRKAGEQGIEALPGESK